ncbi:MAG: spherulation-specific family 4 protein [Asticcacaulis sp.]|uniref:spherulation-specific family 4 protein n=1 Tax=Asticcacaulis sp. TaxID=1872648 RepID=UPI0039E3048C
MRKYLLLLLIWSLPVMAMAKPGLAVVSYWGQRVENFERIPDHTIALINPSSGILAKDSIDTPVDDLDIYKPVFRRAKSHDLSLYGYVPTGYFRHDCNIDGKCQTWARIEGQVKTYFDKMPALQGIFFDETAPADYDCALFAAEYEKLRALVAKYRPGGQIIFNVGMPDTCAVNASASDEMIVLFENDGQHYVNDYKQIKAATELAKSRDVRVWHILNNIPPDQLDIVLRASDVYAPDYLYVIDVSGDWQAGFDTYGDLPAYWKAEVKALTGNK